MADKSFTQYVSELTSEAITSGSDSIPFLDTASGLMKRGTITIPSATSTFWTGLTWTSWSGATMSLTSARVTYHWYLVYFEIHATVTSKGTCAGDFNILWPYTPSTSKIYPLSWGVYASWGIVNRGLPYTQDGIIKFISSAPSTILQWSSIAVGDLIFISGFYETT